MTRGLARGPARPVPAFDAASPELPVRGLAKALFFALLALGKELGQAVPDVSPDAEVKGAEGVAIMREMFAHLFPNLGHRDLIRDPDDAQLKGGGAC